VAQFRRLATENEHLLAENAGMKKTFGELQNELIQARQLLLASQQDCQAARRDLIATRNRLEDWQRVMEKTLDEFQAAEQKHLGELESAIETVRTVVDEQQKKNVNSPAVDARPSDRGNVISG